MNFVSMSHLLSSAIAELPECTDEKLPAELLLPSTVDILPEVQEEHHHHPDDKDAATSKGHDFYKNVFFA